MLHGTTLIILSLLERHLSRPVTGTRRSAPRGLLQSGCSAPVAEGFHRFPLASGPFAKLTFSSRFTRDIISQISFLSSNRSSQQRYLFHQLRFRDNFRRGGVRYKDHAVIKHCGRLKHPIAWREQPHQERIAFSQIPESGVFSNLAAKFRVFRDFCKIKPAAIISGEFCRLSQGVMGIKHLLGAFAG